MWRTFGERFGIAAGLYTTAYAFYEQTGSLPESRFALIAMMVLAVLATAYLIAALASFFGQPQSYFKTFRRPLAESRLHSSQWIESALRWVRLDHDSQQRRFDVRVANYMLRLMRTHSGATVVTRDLSWASANQDELVDLAQNRRLTIFCCSSDEAKLKTDKLVSLAHAGAVVYTVPASMDVRMTLFDRSGESMVAIVRPVGRRHRIEHIRDRSDANFAAALSLVAALRADCTQLVPDEAESG